MSDEQRLQLSIVLRAVSNLQGRGVQVSREVMRLYLRYAVGLISRADVQAIMQARAVALGGQRRYPLSPGNISSHIALLSAVQQPT